MCGRVGSAKRMQEILRNYYKLISIWIKKFLGGKKYFTKIKRAEALFFVYNYYLTKPYKCAIINLDPPLGGRRSRNSHYTTSFKKSQIKSHRRIAQSFFPKSLFFVQPAQPAPAGASSDATHICDPFCLAARARAHMPAAPVESWPLKNFFTHWATGALRQISHMAATLLQTWPSANKNFSSLSSEKIGPIAEIERVQ